MKSNYAVSIIVPVFNVEKYIEQCAVSLFEQNFDSIEYIFVNDATLDNSIGLLQNIINCYPNRKEHIRIIQHEQNEGSGAARKTGIEAATGEYTIQIDPDDWCELNMISVLYGKAIEDRADIVMCDMFEEYPSYQNNRKLKYIPSKVFQNVLSGAISVSLADKLIKRSLYLEFNILPPRNISLAEDRHTIIRLMFFSKTTSYVSIPLYHYRKGHGKSLTQRNTQRNKRDLEIFLVDIKNFLIEQKVFNKYSQDYSILVISQHHHLYISSQGAMGIDDYGNYLKISLLFKKNLAPLRHIGILAYLLGYRKNVAK